MKWRKARTASAVAGNIDQAHRELSSASIALQRRILNTARAMEKFSVDLQASVEELKRVADEAAQRLREEDGHDIPHA